MNAANTFWLVAIVTVLAIGCAVAGYWIDFYLERQRARDLLPKPDKRAVAGESHKVWM